MAARNATGINQLDSTSMWNKMTATAEHRAKDPVVQARELKVWSSAVSRAAEIEAGLGMAGVNRQLRSASQHGATSEEAKIARALSDRLVTLLVTSANASARSEESQPFFR